MLLLSNNDLFKQLLKEISDKLGILPEYVEKDYYAISILKELTSRNEKFVFKGGTSLSVCQKIINRFSEDIDISYLDETITVGQRKKIKQSFFDAIEAVSLHVSNPEDIRSKRVFNRYICSYSSSYNVLGDKVIVEWATQTPAFPIEEKIAQTIIGKYLQQIGRDDLVKQYDLAPFKVLTITKERTLVDKIFAICDYHISKKLDRQSRHIYDIYQLLKYVELNNDFIDLFKKVQKYREDLSTCYSAKKDSVVSKLLFELVEQDTYKKDYNSKTFPLLYDHIKYEQCIPSIIKIAEFLKTNNI